MSPNVTDPLSRRVFWGARMSFDGDQGYRDRRTSRGKVTRRRRKAESWVGRGEFSKPWTETEKEKSVGRKEEEEKEPALEVCDATFLQSLLQSEVCQESPVVWKTKVLMLLFSPPATCNMAFCSLHIMKDSNGNV